MARIVRRNVRKVFKTSGGSSNPGPGPNVPVSTSFTYASTVTPAITNLYARIVHPSHPGPYPLMIYMHGYNTAAASFDQEVLEDMAMAGFVVAAFGMRGKDGASGTPTSNGLCTHDIWDGVAEVRGRISQCDPVKAYAVGFSEGGASILSLISKCPDLCGAYVDHFGISDYGYEADGWYYTNPSFQAGLEGRIGGDPTEVPNLYRVRSFRESVPVNMGSAYLYVFHDASDPTVSVIHSDELTGLLTAAGLSSQYYYNRSELGDNPRWAHGIDTNGSEVYWRSNMANGTTHPMWSVATSGTMKVMGFLYTKRFEIFTGNGQDHVCEVDYNTTSGVFTVTPLTGEVEVTIRFNGDEQTQTISTETTFNF